MGRVEHVVTKSELLYVIQKIKLYPAAVPRYLITSLTVPGV